MHVTGVAWEWWDITCSVAYCRKMLLRMFCYRLVFFLFYFLSWLFIVQEAILSVLKQAARLNGTILRQQVEDVKHKHRTSRCSIYIVIRCIQFIVLTAGSTGTSLPELRLVSLNSHHHGSRFSETHARHSLTSLTRTGTMATEKILFMHSTWDYTAYRKTYNPHSCCMLLVSLMPRPYPLMRKKGLVTIDCANSAILIYE